MTLSDNMRGALLMIGSMTGFTINDAFLKAVSDELPLFQTVFIRGVGVCLLLALLTRAMGQWRWRFSPRDWTMLTIRTLSEMGAAFLFISAIFNMPIANATAILQALPLTVTLAAAVLLKEPLGWRRLLAIAVGFGGVLLIVQPGAAGFNHYALYAVAAVVLITARDLAARRMSANVPSVAAALVSAAGVAGGAGLASLSEPWVALSPLAATQIFAAMCAVICGYVFSVAAMRVGEIAIVAPFRYTSLLVALVIGAAFFGEFPGPLALTGAAIVVAAGLFTLYREARLRRRLAVSDEGVSALRLR